MTGLLIDFDYGESLDFENTASVTSTATTGSADTDADCGVPANTHCESTQIVGSEIIIIVQDH